MKFLVDAQLPPALAHWLREGGHEAEHVEDTGLREANDGAIWAHAVQSGAIIVTKDEDFAARSVQDATAPADLPRFEQVNEKTAALGKMNQELEEANRAKSEFIAAMSHELRTPLNVIMGNAELTGEGFFGEINAEQKKAMTQVRHHSQFLLKMVNDVLALSRLDAKKMSFEPSTVRIDELVMHVQGQVEQLNRNKNLEVTWKVDPVIPDIETDAIKVEEILQNLIGNAFKFTPRGRIDIRIRNLRALDRVEFSVADTGIGIEPQDMDRIFSAFEQIQEAHTGDFNGVGLGLNLVKKISRPHGRRN